MYAYFMIILFIFKALQNTWLSKLVGYPNNKSMHVIKRALRSSRIRVECLRNFNIEVISNCISFLCKGTEVYSNIRMHVTKVT